MLCSRNSSVHQDNDDNDDLHPSVVSQSELLLVKISKIEMGTLREAGLINYNRNVMNRCFGSLLDLSVPACLVNQSLEFGNVDD